MFQKPFRIKSNIQMKNSERKAFKSTVLQQFPYIDEDKLNNLFGNKEIFSVLKAATHHNENTFIYMVQKRPMFFTYNDTLYPTIYLLWNIPSLIPSITAESCLLQKLITGADLMLPGVVMPEGTENAFIYGNINEGSIVSVNLKHNSAAIAVGTTVLSGLKIHFSEKGKCVKVLHSFEDKLFTIDGCEVLPVPKFGPPYWLKVKNADKNIEMCSEQFIIESKCNSEFNGSLSNLLNVNTEKTAENIDKDEDKKLCQSNDCHVESEENKIDLVTTEQMDWLFNYCFLKVIKELGQKNNLPILTSSFFKLMMQACPAGKQLDLKKSSFKKFSLFLKKMIQDGIIEITEKSKGVENITSVNLTHEKLESFVLEKDDNLNLNNSEKDKTVEPSVSETYSITSLALPIFRDAGYSKGDMITKQDCRKYITDYVKQKGLQDKNNKGLIIPNTELANIIKSDRPVSWENIMQSVIKVMSISFKITSCTGNEMKGKGKAEPIVLTVVRRSGNKKVTVIENLELYGIQIAEFGKECQHGIAASISINKPPGKKYNQLLVQGNQVLFVGNLLTNKYKIPKKYIQGLDLVPKKK